MQEWLYLLTLVVAVGALVMFANRRKAIVAPWEKGLLYRNGIFVREADPGPLVWFDPLRRTQFHNVDILARAQLPAMLEVISKDQFAFRITVAPVVTVTDARAFHEGAPPLGNDPNSWMLGGHRYPRLQTELAAAALAQISRHTLDEFLKDPAAALAPVQARLAEVLPGSRLDGLAVTAVTLPPEVRKMFTEVERAKREGLANLERARAEQAALRALANAARTMAGNPQLAQLRMLQTMESAKGAKTFILGKPSEEFGIEPAAKP